MIVRCPSVRPVSVHPATTANIVRSVLDRSSPNLEHSFPLTPRIKYFLGSPRNGRGQGHVTKFLIWSRRRHAGRHVEKFRTPKWSGSRGKKNLILHPLLISGIVIGKPFKFYTELNREKYNIYIYRNLGIV